MKKLLLLIFSIFPTAAFAAWTDSSWNPQVTFSTTVTATDFNSTQNGYKFPDGSRQTSAAVSVSTAGFLDTSASTQTKTGGLNVLSSLSVGTTTSLGYVTVITSGPSNSNNFSSYAYGIGQAGYYANVLNGGSGFSANSIGNSYGMRSVQNGAYPAASFANASGPSIEALGNVGIGSFPTDNVTSALDVLAGSVTIRGTGAGLAVTAPGGTTTTYVQVSSGTTPMFRVTGSTVTIGGTGGFVNLPTIITGGAVCVNASGRMSKCTSIVDASGNCTCP